MVKLKNTQEKKTVYFILSLLIHFTTTKQLNINQRFKVPGQLYIGRLSFSVMGFPLY